MHYQLEILEDTVSVKKRKTEKPLVKIEIDDANLFNIYRKNLLLAEIVIQERVKLSGAKKNTEKLMQLLSKFLEN